MHPVSAFPSSAARSMTIRLTLKHEHAAEHNRIFRDLGIRQWNDDFVDFEADKATADAAVTVDENAGPAAEH
ncbi:hypothetical protein ERY430_40568 [Erythrobacter sp. EC-HK427]|nr:hypothetical protein ERY430_40568 [Erythrobacter sp. EC-HK427]